MYLQVSVCGFKRQISCKSTYITAKTLDFEATEKVSLSLTDFFRTFNFVGFWGSLCPGLFGLGPAGVVGRAADLPVGADADVVGRVGRQALQGHAGAVDALDGHRLGVEEVGVGAVGELVAGVQLALLPDRGDLALAGGQL